MSYILKEQETHLYIDYYEKEVILYTNRQSVYKRLVKKIGVPNKLDMSENIFYSATWNIPFAETCKIRTALSRPTLVGNIK